MSPYHGSLRKQEVRTEEGSSRRGKTHRSRPASSSSSSSASSISKGKAKMGFALPGMYEINPKENKDSFRPFGGDNGCYAETEIKYNIWWFPGKKEGRKELDCW